MTVMNKDAPATKGDLDTSFEDMQGYVDTAVDTLTEEMDRQFKEVRGDIKHLQDDVTMIKDKVSDTQEDVKAIKNFLMPMPPEDENDGD